MKKLLSVSAISSALAFSAVAIAGKDGTSALSIASQPGNEELAFIKTGLPDLSPPDLSALDVSDS